MPSNKQRMDDLAEQAQALQGERAALRKNVVKMGERIQDMWGVLGNTQKAQAIIQEVAKKTQEQLEFHVSELASLALSSVFDDPYRLVLRFEEKRGKTEAALLFARGGMEIDPVSCAGGGAVDVAALALQIALWKLQHPRTAPVLILDEPLTALKGGELPQRGAAIIKELAGQMGMQVLMVSHNPELIDEADKVFEF